MSDRFYSYPRYNNEPLRFTGYEALNVAAAYKQQADAQARPPEQVVTGTGGSGQAASSLPELWTAVYPLSGLMIRDVTAKKAREIAATELSRHLAEGLREKIQASMKALPASVNIDAVRYEVQFLIHTREEFRKAVRAEAKKLLESALS